MTPLLPILSKNILAVSLQLVMLDYNRMTMTILHTNEEVLNILFFFSLFSSLLHLFLCSEKGWIGFKGSRRQIQ